MKAVIIGLGKVAWKFDEKEKDSPGARTHYKALVNNGNFDIYGIDIHEKAASEFTEKTGAQSFSDVKDFLSFHNNADLVCITSPSQNHYEHFLTALSLNPKWIWLEKPAGTSSAEVSHMLKMKAQNDVSVLVNYPRRFAAPYLRLFSLVNQKTFGKLRSIDCHYSRELRTNGCHMLDLIIWYLEGNVPHVMFTDVAKNNPSAFLEHDDIKIYLHGSDVSYHNLDISLTFEEGRASVIHGGSILRIEKRIPNPEFPMFSRLELAEETIYETSGNNFDEVLTSLISGSKGASLEDSYTLETLMESIERRLNT